MAIDLSTVEGFDWDDGNARKSADKHGVSQAEAEQVFVNRPLLIVEDSGHSKSETRYNALGTIANGRVMHITFTVRRNLIRIISARDANRRERAIFAGGKDEEET